MSEERTPVVDHTGEIHNNRRITGPGSYHKPPSGHGFWSWRWECLECGAIGEAHNYGQVKYWSHFCPGKSRTVHPRKYTVQTAGAAKRKPKIDWRKVCGPQCHDCGHFDDYSGACIYILDTGHRRPQVDLRHEPCPVRDTQFKRPGLTWPEPLTPKDGKENVR